jgi:serine/threonine protein kinase
MSEPLLPQRFRVLRRLGEGGMGIVYEALDEERRERVALKTIRDVTAESLARFKREFRALADVHHPNLVTLGELFSEGPLWFFTMELVEGEDFLAYTRGAAPELAHDASTVAASPFLPSAPALATSPTERSLGLGPTVRFVRIEGGGLGDGTFDEERLRDCMRQLASAVAAVHDAGMIHRDVKPTNIRVTPAGRLVLLDFGLVAEVHPTSFATRTSSAGTPAYMAPEQAAATTIGPEADWYAVGVILYEALTGRLPFDGASPLEIIMRKQQGEPAPPSTLAPGVPADLDALATSLLRLDPHARPSAARVLQTLGAVAADARRSSSLTLTAPFVGRASELAGLRAAFEATRERRAVVVVVEGESGLGKSFLARKFVDTLALEHSNLVVLAGRCSEREAVPFKAFDSAIDALTRFLLRAPAEVAAGVLPTRVAPLAQVFPVLRRVEAIANAVRGPMPAVDPLELRSRAFAAFREMMTRLAELPLVLLIDDFQWADADSLALLTDLMRPPEAPPLLLLVTTRPAASAERDGPGSALASLRSMGDVRMLRLGALSDAEANELATWALGRVASAADAATIVREARGHPFFIEALARHAALPGVDASIGRLEEALWWSVASLDDPTRLVMELVAVAGGPIARGVLAIAANAESADLRPRLAMLRVAHLISTAGDRPDDVLEAYHDQVRGAVLAHLDDAVKVQRHRSLAIALERARSHEAEALTRHWLGAGEPALAAKYATVAAAEATRALAFDRAAMLYEEALSLVDHTPAEQRALYEKLGDALANGGHGGRAAAAYRRAANGANAGAALDLHRRAADQLLRTGHIDDGLAAARRVLGWIGMRFPGTPWTALLALLVARLVLRVRGLDFRPRDPTLVPSNDLMRIDVCWSIATNLALVDAINATYFQVRGLLLALRAGERARVARWMALEVAFLATRGGRAEERMSRVLDRTRALAREVGDANTRAWALGTEGCAALLLGRWKTAFARCDAAERIFREECVGIHWEVGTMRWFSLWALAYQGRIADLSSGTPPRLREAERRADLQQVIGHSTGLASMIWLASDEPREVHRRGDEALARWSEAAFHVEHWWNMLGQAQAELYAGDAVAALTRIRRAWPALESSLLLRVQLTRVEARHLRARAAVAVAAATRNTEESGAALLREAERDARAIEREGLSWSAPLSKLLRAGIDVVRGERPERAATLLRDAIVELDSADMALYAAAARRCLGGILDGDEGRALVRGADDWMANETIKNPARMVNMLAPGLRSGP